MTKLSVIVPNYNHAPYLPARLDSILGQTRGDFELLVLDDCSSDDSREVIRAYAARDPRLRHHFNEANAGSPYLQWRRGLAMTSGEYVWIAESDDVAELSLLEALAGALDGDAAAGLAVANSRVIDGEGAPVGDYWGEWRRTGLADYDPDAFERDFRMDGRDYCARYMVPWNTIPNASAVLFRRSTLAAAGGPVTRMRLCGDWMTYCRMLMRSDIVRVAARLNHFRQHPASAGSRTRLVDYVEEAVAVHRYVAEALGGSPRASLARVRRHYCNAVIAQERRPPAGKIPPARVPAALAQAARFGPGMLAQAGRIVARELAADVAGRLGLKRSPAR